MANSFDRLLQLVLQQGFLISTGRLHNSGRQLTSGLASSVDAAACSLDDYGRAAEITRNDEAIAHFDAASL